MFIGNIVDCIRLRLDKLEDDIFNAEIENIFKRVYYNGTSTYGAY
ncbi:hypothetical protein P792_13530 [Asaia sp. SF2.1]|nr:hypothetical protein P792_13530 [Asaia sp. SF2.1]